MLRHTLAIPARPKLFDETNSMRSVYQTVRQQILDENFTEVLIEWIQETEGPDATHRFGNPDTSLNPLASNTRQLTTPGLYGKTPDVRYPESARELLGPGGHFERAGVWTRAQTLQYYTVGQGVYFRNPMVIAHRLTGEPVLVDRIVSPRDIVVFVDEANPSEPVAVWELRLRQVDKKPKWCFDVWDIENKEEPSFSVKEVNYGGEITEDVTSNVVPDYDGWVWKTPEGIPFLPWVVYRAVDSGDFWPEYRRGMHQGTLRACTHWTYTSRSALFATGEHHLVVGVNPDSIPATVKRGDWNNQQESTPQRSMAVTPGMITFLQPNDGESTTFHSIGPGVNLPNLSAFANMYHMQMAVVDGLNPTDATRKSANPTSGAALEISSESRRAYSMQVEPLFRRADSEYIRKVADMFRAAGVDYGDTSEVSVTYHQISLTPTEREDLRADLEWQVTQGQISPAEAYMKLNPGVSREAAVKAVVAARVETATIDQMVSDQLAALGIEVEDPDAQDDTTNREDT